MGSRLHSDTPLLQDLARHLTSCPWSLSHTLNLVSAMTYPPPKPPSSIVFVVHHLFSGLPFIPVPRPRQNSSNSTGTLNHRFYRFPPGFTFLMPTPPPPTILQVSLSHAFNIPSPLSVSVLLPQSLSSPCQPLGK